MTDPAGDVDMLASGENYDDFESHLLEDDTPVKGTLQQFQERAASYSDRQFTLSGSTLLLFSGGSCVMNVCLAGARVVDSAATEFEVAIPSISKPLRFRCKDASAKATCVCLLTVACDRVAALKAVLRARREERLALLRSRDEAVGRVAQLEAQTGALRADLVAPDAKPMYTGIQTMVRREEVQALRERIQAQDLELQSLRDFQWEAKATLAKERSKRDRVEDQSHLLTVQLEQERGALESLAEDLRQQLADRSAALDRASQEAQRLGAQVDDLHREAEAAGERAKQERGALESAAEDLRRQLADCTALLGRSTKEAQRLRVPVDELHRKVEAAGQRAQMEHHSALLCPNDADTSFLSAMSDASPNVCPPSSPISGKAVQFSASSPLNGCSPAPFRRHPAPFAAPSSDLEGDPAESGKHAFSTDSEFEKNASALSMTSPTRLPAGDSGSGLVTDFAMLARGPTGSASGSEGGSDHCQKTGGDGPKSAPSHPAIEHQRAGPQPSLLPPGTEPRCGSDTSQATAASRIRSSNPQPGSPRTLTGYRFGETWEWPESVRSLQRLDTDLSSVAPVDIADLVSEEFDALDVDGDGYLTSLQCAAVVGDRWMGRPLLLCLNVLVEMGCLTIVEAEVAPGSELEVQPEELISTPIRNSSTTTSLFASSDMPLADCVQAMLDNGTATSISVDFFRFLKLRERLQPLATPRPPPLRNSVSSQLPERRPTEALLRLERAQTLRREAELEGRLIELQRQLEALESEARRRAELEPKTSDVETIDEVARLREYVAELEQQAASAAEVHGQVFRRLELAQEHLAASQEARTQLLDKLQALRAEVREKERNTVPTHALQSLAALLAPLAAKVEVTLTVDEGAEGLLASVELLAHLLQERLVGLEDQVWALDAENAAVLKGCAALEADLKAALYQLPCSPYSPTETEDQIQHLSQLLDASPIRLSAPGPGYPEHIPLPTPSSGASSASMSRTADPRDELLEVQGPPDPSPGPPVFLPHIPLLHFPTTHCQSASSGSSSQEIPDDAERLLLLLTTEKDVLSAELQGCKGTLTAVENAYRELEAQCRRLSEECLHLRDDRENLLRRLPSVFQVDERATAERLDTDRRRLLSLETTLQQQRVTLEAEIQTLASHSQALEHEAATGRRDSGNNQRRLQLQIQRLERRMLQQQKEIESLKLEKAQASTRTELVTIDYYEVLLKDMQRKLGVCGQKLAEERSRSRQLQAACEALHRSPHDPAAAAPHRRCGSPERSPFASASDSSFVHPTHHPGDFAPITVPSYASPTFSSSSACTPVRRFLRSPGQISSTSGQPGLRRGSEPTALTVQAFCV